jgi:tRNA1(Val) A37 N6-methylase TrmN6
MQGEADPAPPPVRPFLGGLLALAQPRAGHRAGTDAVLLACAGPADFDAAAVDLGAGTGAVGLAFARLAPAARVTLVEIDPELARLARDNAARNALDDRVAMVEADILATRGERRAAGLVAGAASLVLTNPPFLDARSARLSTDPSRRRAHAMPEGGLAAWIGTAADCLAPGGTCIAIHRADALAELLQAFAKDFGAMTVLPVQARADEPAIRVLLRGRKGSRGPLSLRPGLVLHDAAGRFTPEAEALHRGEAVIGW